MDAKDFEKISKDIAEVNRLIEMAKRELHQMEGREQELLKRLESLFGITTIEVAQKKQIEIQNRLEELKNLIYEKYEEIKSKFEW